MALLYQQKLICQYGRPCGSEHSSPDTLSVRRPAPHCASSALTIRVATMPGLTRLHARSTMGHTDPQNRASAARGEQAREEGEQHREHAEEGRELAEAERVSHDDSVADAELHRAAAETQRA